MTSPRYQIVSTHPRRIFTLEQAADLSGMHPEMILEFVRAELVDGQLGRRHPESSPHFDESALVRIRQIERLRREHVNLRTVRYILHLLDSLEATRQELRSLRERLR